MYDLLEKLIKTERPELMPAEFALAWRQGWKRNKDGQIGRTCFRMRKHDLEEFREIVEKYGCYKKDIEDFCLAAINSKRPPQPSLPGMDASETIPMPSAAKRKKSAV